MFPLNISLFAGDLQITEVCLRARRIPEKHQRSGTTFSDLPNFGGTVFGSGLLDCVRGVSSHCHLPTAPRGSTAAGRDGGRRVYR